MESVESKGFLVYSCACCARSYDPRLGLGFICPDCWRDTREVPGWDAYFMEMAKTAAIRSKDPHTQVGAVLVEDNRIIGTGYNGFAPGIHEAPIHWQRPFKYDRVIHAEMNCILHAVKSPKGATLYTTMYPCKECAKLIATAGIKRIVYLSDKYKNEPARELFAGCSIEVVKLN